MLARKPNRLPRSCYLGRHWYFITVCTGGRRLLFLQGQLVERLLQTLRAACGSWPFNVYAYCFMPDHAHLELTGLAGNSDLIGMLRERVARTAGAAVRVF